MDGGGDDHYFEELSNSDHFGYFTSASEYGFPPTPNSFSPAGNIHPQASPFLSAGNHRNGFPVLDNNYDPLELKFGRMNLLPPQFPRDPHAFELMNLQNTWAQYLVDLQRMNLIHETSSSRLVSPGRRIVSSSSSLSNLRGRIVLTATDRSGCRFLEEKLEQGNRDDVQLIFSELKHHVCELAIHQFGNCLLQNLFKFVDEDQMNQLLCLLVRDERRFKIICTHMHGSRAVQKLLEHLTTRDQRALVLSVLAHITISLIKNSNGQHVIQQCLRYFYPEDNKHILNVVADNCLDVAIDKSGCCVLQQCLSHSAGESRHRLFAQIISSALVLSEHPYGNYVVQYIIGFKIPQVTTDVLVQLFGNYVPLSMNKYGSNVIEACLKHSEGNEALPIVEELIKSPNFLRVLQDPYGNFVAQIAIHHTKGAARQALIRLVNLNYPFLHSHPYGKRVLACAKGLYKQQRANVHA